ncbi:MAG: hypothetical protein ABTQ26_04445, partial [Azonexus sp.]
LLKDSLPDEVDEPDRTWLALAAYNIGPRHFNNARLLARQLKADPNSWYEMKRVLPKMAQPKYLQQLKINRARGGEAVILVENIRSYYDILMHNASAFGPSPSAAAGIQRLVDEIEQRRKANVKKVMAAKSISATGMDDSRSDTPRLPTIDQDVSPTRPAEAE